MSQAVFRRLGSTVTKLFPTTLRNVFALVLAESLDVSFGSFERGVIA